MAANVVRELVDTEEVYVQKLELLSQTFRKMVVAEKLLIEDQATLFANISSLYEFHSHFHRQLSEAAREWNHTKRISSVIKRLAEYLKMSASYMTSYTNAMEVFKKGMKIARFVEIVEALQTLQICGGISLQELFICPVQRITKYELLLKEYQKHLAKSDADYDDTIFALVLVMDAANHANEALRHWEGSQYLVEIQKELKGSVALVSPGRQLIRKGQIKNARWIDCENGSLTIHLYTDLVLLVGEATSAVLGTQRYIFVFYPQETVITRDEDGTNPFTFCISDVQKRKCYVQPICENKLEYEEWVDALEKVIDDKTPKDNFDCLKCLVSPCRHFGLNQTFNINPHLKTLTNTSEQNGLQRSKSFLEKAASALRRTFSLQPQEKKKHQQKLQEQAKQEKPQQQLVALKENVLYFNWIFFDDTKRFMEVGDDCHIYIYNQPTDLRPIAKLALPGCLVRLDEEPSTFYIGVEEEEYKITCADDEIQTTLLDLIANAQFTTLPS